MSGPWNEGSDLPWRYDKAKAADGGPLWFRIVDVHGKTLAFIRDDLSEVRPAEDPPPRNPSAEEGLDSTTIADLLRRAVELLTLKRGLVSRRRAATLVAAALRGVASPDGARSISPDPEAELSALDPEPDPRSLVLEELAATARRYSEAAEKYPEADDRRDIFNNAAVALYRRVHKEARRLGLPSPVSEVRL